MDSYSKAEKSKPSSVGTDTFAATSRTERDRNNCQPSWESSRTAPGTSIIPAAGLRDVNETDTVVATNGHLDPVLARNACNENGYGFPPDKLRSDANRDVKNFQYEHRQRAKKLESEVDGDSYFQGNRAKSSTRHSEVTKIVPLKPQRSKKSLNKEDKDVVNAQTQSQFDRSTFGEAGDARVTKSSCESGRRSDDSSARQSAVLYQEQSQLRKQMNNESFPQQELRDCMDTTMQGQWMRGSSLQEDIFHNISEFGSKFSAAPPRTLPLKTHWSRDRPSNMDSSHIHYRTPSQETAKRKQAVNRLPPPLTCLSIIGK